jgi:hypothetical protein
MVVGGSDIVIDISVIVVEYIPVVGALKIVGNSSVVLVND